MQFESTNPATEEVEVTLPGLDAAGIDAALARADRAFHDWSTTSLSLRTDVLRRAAEALRRRRTELAELMAREMGKVILEGEAEADKCAWVCEYYAEAAPSLLEPESIATDAGRSYVRFDPLGPVLAVMPWNFPFWQVFRFAAPALAAGNVGLLKHAANVPRCARAIEAIFREAGAPEGVFQTLLITSAQVERVLESPTVKAATLTGSEAAGSAVAATCGRLLKKTVLELGGSDPFLVLDDADPQAAAAWAARARTINAGQSCIAAKRFLVAGPIADRFVGALQRELEALPVGDPLARETRIGPLARPDLVADLERQVESSVSAGAQLVTGGRRLPRPGWFYAPTLLDHVRPGMAVFDEETFGPVAAVTRVDTDEEALRLANFSPFGLGASIWSSDPDRAERLVPRMEAGCVFVNGMVKSDPRLPFGGIKRSGYGRELSGYGLREFVNIKSVWIGSR